MGKLHSRIQYKIIITIVAIIMLCNFVMPNYSYAETDTEGGGELMDYVGKFLCAIPDATLTLLQRFFVTVQPLEDNLEYKIRYSPAVIFTGGVPAFDIDFITPMESKRDEINKRDVTQDVILETCKEYYQGTDDTYIFKDSGMTIDEFKQAYNYSSSSITTFDSKNKNYDEKIEVWHFGENTCLISSSSDGFDDDQDGVIDNSMYCYSIPTDVYNTQFVVEKDEDGNDVLRNTKEYKSTAEILQPIVASWYKALRRIALVGLLSVLVYIGIRIVLFSASAQDAAKYKKMLVDWVAAICLLFTLHYFMSMTITVVKKITEIASASVIGANGEDILMSKVRNDIADGGSFSIVIAELIIYDILTVFTIIFTIQYLRRTIYLAFLTIIAPLITLTYPLDKIKDSKAQAFDTWFKDYVFFTLLQVVHALIYWILLGSAIELLNKEYWLIAIVAIGFLTKAESIIKKMFGFEKAPSMGALAAGASGALIMNAINQIKASTSGGRKKGKPSSGGSSGSSEGNANVRTANNPNALQALQGDDSVLEGQRQQENQQEQEDQEETHEEEQEMRSQMQEDAQTENSEAQELQQPAVRTLNNRREERRQRRRRNLRGVGAIAGRYTGPILRQAFGAFGTVAGATVGFAAGAAQGDIGKAITGLAAGAGAGYYGTQKLANLGGNLAHGVTHIGDKFDEIADVFNEGAGGREYADNIRFKRTDEYRQLSQTPNFSEESVDKMYAAGIRDTDDMERILNSGGNIEEEMGYLELAKQCPDEILFGNSENLQEYLEVVLKKSNLDPSVAKQIGERIKKYK